MRGIEGLEGGKGNIYDLNIISKNKKIKTAKFENRQNT